MGKLVNVVLPTGRVVSVPEEDATLLDKETSDQAYNRFATDNRADKGTGVGNTIQAGIEGAADAVSFGAAGKVLSAVGGSEEAQQYQERAQAHPYVRMAGEMGALLLPGGAAGGAFAREATAAATGSMALGRAAEGAAYGAGFSVAHTNVTGDPLTIEGAVEGATIGAILNVGMGIAADKVMGAVGRAQAAKAEQAELAANQEVVRKNAQLFSESPAYSEARESYKAAVSANKSLTKEVQAEIDAYNDFLGNKEGQTGGDFKKAVGKAEGVINTHRDYYEPVGSPVKEVDADGRRVFRGYNDVPPALQDAPEQALSDAGYQERMRVGMRPEARGGPIKQPMSPEFSDRLQNYRERISKIYKQFAGGWKTDGANKWVRDAASVADKEGAMSELRRLQDDLMKDFPKASGKLSDLPPPPRALPPQIEATNLPASLREFARKQGSAVEKLAAGMDPTTQEAFGKLADEIGVERGAAAGDTVKAIHGRLGEVFSAYEKLKAAQAAEAVTAKSGGIMSWIGKFGRGAAGLASGRYVNTLMGGGWRGAVGQVAAGDAARAGVEGVQDAMFGNALVASKETLRTKIRDLVSQYGTGAASAVKALGPVTTYLATSFPSGQKDPETDPRKQAVNRIADIHAAVQSAPDALYMAVNGMLGQPGDIGWKIHSRITQGLQYLASALPKDPGLDLLGLKSNWTPAHDQVIALAHTMEAVLNPIGAMARSLTGDGHPAATDALWATSPATMSEFSGEMCMALPAEKEISYSQTRNLSGIFKAPMSAFQQPAVITALQSLYLPKPQDQGSGGGGGSKSSNPTGRPPAVQSQVAGSSVSGLIR